jgi:glucokinase
MLGKGLSIIVDILNPEKIVIGGVYMRSSALLIPSMQKVLKAQALNESLQVCEIVPAKLSENIGDIAALSLASM